MLGLIEHLLGPLFVARARLHLGEDLDVLVEREGDAHLVRVRTGARLASGIGAGVRFGSGIGETKP